MRLQNKGSLILLLHLSYEHIQSTHSIRYHKEEHKIMKLILANIPKISAVSCHTSRKDFFGFVLKTVFIETPTREKQRGSPSSSKSLSWEKGVSSSTNDLQAYYSCNLSKKNSTSVNFEASSQISIYISESLRYPIIVSMHFNLHPTERIQTEKHYMVWGHFLYIKLWLKISVLPRLE